MKFGEVVTTPPPAAYRNYVLGLFAALYALNFIDRQVIAVVALDLKRDLNMSDADLGFLYGTAFGVFYALFGIPLGRLADSWNRVRLMTVGLALWSVMTALSGAARSGLQLTAARIGVGVGEASASPCAYSILSDYFPREKRATALATYTAGTYIGAGLSLFLGAEVLKRWNAAFPDGWHGIVGWQATFVAMGLPGIVLAFVVARLKEPARGLSDGMIAPPVPHPFRAFGEELLTMVPPLTLIGAARRGVGALLGNLAGATIIAAIAGGLIRLTGDVLQWASVGIGVYAVFSWAAALRSRDYPAFVLIWKSPAFLLLLLGHGLAALVAYAVVFWSLPYAETAFHVEKSTAGLLIGGAGAAGGFLGAILGGRLADSLRRRHPSGRVLVILACAGLPVIPMAISFTTSSETLFYVLHLPTIVLTSLGMGASAATTQDLVLPRMRGVATATFLLALTLIGLALGPYGVGRLVPVTGSLSNALLLMLCITPLPVACLVALYFKLPAAEASVVERARAAGEEL